MNRLLTTLTAGALMLSIGIAPAVAQKSNKRQVDKNLMRNLGIAGGVIAADKLLHGKTNEALVAGAAAAYAGKKYEDQRKAQSHSKSWRKYVYRHGRKVGYYVMRGNHRVRYVRA